MIGPQGLLIALGIGLFLFGAKKLPELARGLGESLKEFKRASTHEADMPVSASSPAPPPSPASPPRACAACQTPLQAAWAHCPKCGASA